MIIQKADLFKDLSPMILDQISKVMVEENFDKNTFIFKAGSPADCFYILMDGRVRLVIGTESEIGYTVNTPGEAFGWTGLVDRPTYTASAECVAPGKMIKIDRNALAKIFENDTTSGMKFYKRLAEAVVQRLIFNYQAFLSEGSLKSVTPDYGVGHMGSDED